MMTREAIVTRNCQNCLFCKLDPKGWKLIEHPDGKIEKVGLLKCKPKDKDSIDWWDGRRIRYRWNQDWSNIMFLRIKAQHCPDYEPVYPLTKGIDDARDEQPKRRVHHETQTIRHAPSYGRHVGYRIEHKRSE